MLYPTSFSSHQTNFYSVPMCPGNESVSINVQLVILTLILILRDLFIFDVTGPHHCDMGTHYRKEDMFSMLADTF